MEAEWWDPERANFKFEDLIQVQVQEVQIQDLNSSLILDICKEILDSNYFRLQGFKFIQDYMEMELIQDEDQRIQDHVKSMVSNLDLFLDLFISDFLG